MISKKRITKFNFLNNSKTLNQSSKFLITVIFCIILLLGIELIFSIPEISNFFDEGLLENKYGVMFWVILWLVMFSQVTFIPIPAMPIYTLCNKIPDLVGGEGILGLFSWRTLFFCSFVTSACVAGCLLAYLLGRLGGKGIVKWVAGNEDEFNSWCYKLNGKKGKLLYSVTVFLPLFPDDLLSIAMGSLKMDLKFYTIINIMGKFVGAFCMLLFMRLPYINEFFNSSGGDFPTL